MKLAKIITAILIFQSFAGCNNTSEEDEMTAAESTSTSVPVSPAVAADSNTIQPVTIQPNLPITTKAALNPEHGKPGHRCDIAVGAPLDSKPTNQTANTTPQEPIAIAPQQSTIVAPSGGAGLNPAHGQPNHRCDIAVGAPLNSKPTQSAVSANQQPAIAPVNQTPAPAPIINLKPGETTKTGMNPAHGQPGHRCDIAVGAPLNSKPAQ
jgi:hypothetical protein